MTSGRNERAVERARSVLDACWKATARVPLGVLAATSVAWLIAVNGAWHTPSIGFLTAYARDVFDPPPLGDQAYAVYSPLGPLLAWATGLGKSASQFSLLHATAGLAALALVLGAARQWHGDLLGRAVLVAFVASSVSVALMHWLGLPDPFVFLAGSIAVLGTGTAMTVVAGGLLGFAHFEQGVVIVGALTALSWGYAWRRLTPRHLVGLTAGLIAGRLLLALYHLAYAVETTTDRFEYARRFGLHDLVSRSADAAIGLVASMYAIWWLVVGYVGATMLRRSARLAVSFFLVHVAMVGVMVVTRDQTRVFAMVSWPVVVWTLLWACENMRRRTLERLIALTFVLALALPYRFDFFDGRDRGSYRTELSDWVFG